MILSKGLRQEMQNILDDMQSDIANELDKVSLERLADINPDLLINIKNAAADAVGLMNNSQQQLQSFTQNKSSNARLLPPSSKKQHSSSSSSLPPFLLEIRSETTMSRSNEWNDYMTAHHPDGRLVTERILVNLKKLVMTGTNEAIVDNDDNDDNPAKLSAEGNDSVVVYTKTEALDMTQYYATGLTVAQILSDAMERNISTQIEIERRDTHSTIFADKNQSLGLHRSTDNENKSYNTNKTSATSAAIGSRRRRMGADNRLAAVVDLANFTNEGIKEANPGAISLLYELGLPFQSTADGLRFATQLELSQHLDGLFKRNQLRKTIAVTEERGWYVSDRIWTREQSALDEDALLQASAAGSSGDDERLAFRNSSSTPITSSSMVPADETRDRCVVCGIPFQMVFDNDDGVYKYKNCLEILLLHDNEDNDVAIQVDSQQQLVHVTCWNGLGQPTVLTYDQTLPDVCSFQHETD